MGVIDKNIKRDNIPDSLSQTGWIFSIHSFLYYSIGLHHLPHIVVEVQLSIPGRLSLVASATEALAMTSAQAMSIMAWASFSVTVSSELTSVCMTSSNGLSNGAWGNSDGEIWPVPFETP